ncbi:MAG TPA: hypothetical protein VEQ58_02440 [Polyangiaceae bacterium]|nr:hypothetical protein [Polyangiaceae bacterium]
MSVGGALLTASSAHATLLRGLTLRALVARSQRIVVVEPLDAVCRHEVIGGRRSIVTDTRVLAHEYWAEGSELELTVRTLGGRLDGVGELVDGQPRLELRQRSVAFLTLGRNGQQWWTTGMAQGNFPLTGDGEASLLQASRELPSIVDLEHSAVQRLVGQKLSVARELVHQARAK